MAARNSSHRINMSHSSSRISVNADRTAVTDRLDSLQQNISQRNLTKHVTAILAFLTSWADHGRKRVMTSSVSVLCQSQLVTGSPSYCEIKLTALMTSSCHTVSVFNLSLMQASVSTFFQTKILWSSRKTVIPKYYFSFCLSFVWCRFRLLEATRRRDVTSVSRFEETRYPSVRSCFVSK